MQIRKNKSDLIVSFGDAEIKFTPNERFITLEESIKSKASDVYEMINDVVTTVPAVMEMVNGLGTEQIITVQIPQDVQQKIKEGIYTMTTKKGVLRAVVRDAKTGEIVKHLDLTIRDLPEGFDLTKIAAYSETVAIQKQLDSIAKEIKAIQVGLDDVLTGLQNDRIAQYLSGASLYSEARLVGDEELRKQLTAQSLMRLSNAFHQLSEEARTDIQALSERYNQDKLRIEGMKSKEVYSKIDNINICFDSLLKIAQTRAAIYYEQNEIPAMIQTLDAYALFLKDTLTDINTEMLYQFDRSDMEIEGGTWYSRSEELPKMIEGVKDNYSIPVSENVIFQIGSKNKKANRR